MRKQAIPPVPPSRPELASRRSASFLRGWRVDMHHLFPIAGMYKAANQSIGGNGAVTKVLLDTLIVDAGKDEADDSGNHMVDTSNNQIVIRRPGWYVATGAVIWEGLDAGTYREVRITDGVSSYGISRVAQIPGSTAETMLLTTPPIDCDAGDTFDLRVAQDSGFSRSVISFGDPSYTPGLWVYMVAL